MKRFFYLFLLMGIASIIACNKDDDDDHDDTPEYHAHIHSPSTTDKHVGDTMHIHVVFEEHAGLTVHHVNVKIYNENDTSEVIYNGPADAHVHAETGKFELHDDFILNDANGVAGHTDWILEAKVWGHEAGEAEVTETVKFHVHP